jgi:hypothetical protein
VLHRSRDCGSPASTREHCLLKSRPLGTHTVCGIWRVAARTVTSILGWLAIVSPVTADVVRVERAGTDPANASLIRKSSALQPPALFASRVRLACLDNGERDRICRPEARPFSPRQTIAFLREQPSDAPPAANSPVVCGETDVVCSSAAFLIGPRRAWPRVIGRAPIAWQVPNAWLDPLVQDRPLLHQAPPDPTPPFDRQSSPVDEYLCSVYWRMPHKIDNAGDFSWKDRAAAALVGRTVCDYAINGMHQDLREALYVLGQSADAAGINWSLLSGFRDNFRQRIASGFKASDCKSWHGGSCRTQGWGDGRAADLWVADQNGYPVRDASALLALVDQMAPALGLSRPMPGADPPHVQLRGARQERARTLHGERLRSMSVAGDR